MKTLFIYGYFLGLTLASSIKRFQECNEGLSRISNTENNGDHREKNACVQMKLHSTETPKIDPTMQPSLNDIVTGIKVKDESGATNVKSSIEIRSSPIIKYQSRRDLSHLTQKPPKKRNNGKKHRLKKIIQSHNAYNASRKIQVNDMLKHRIEKGSIIKQLQKRSTDYEDTPSDPYHSPDISYDSDMQEKFTENDDSQELNESEGLAKTADDFSSKVMNENSDPIDSSESDHISTSESSNPRGSSESSSPMGPNESNSSNESSDETKSEESICDDTNKPIVLTEARDSQESSEPNVQNIVFSTPTSETTNVLSDATPSSESWNPDDSSQSNEHNESSKSSDSNSSESSNSSDSSTSSHSKESNTQSDNSTENSNQYAEGTMITDDIEENEIDS